MDYGLSLAGLHKLRPPAGCNEKLVLPTRSVRKLHSPLPVSHEGFSSKYWDLADGCADFLFHHTLFPVPFCGSIDGDGKLCAYGNSAFVMIKGEIAFLGFLTTRYWAISGRKWVCRGTSFTDWTYNPSFQNAGLLSVTFPARVKATKTAGTLPRWLRLPIWPVLKSLLSTELRINTPIGSIMV
jgi:hypothetical protein